MIHITPDNKLLKYHIEELTIVCITKRFS